MVSEKVHGVYLDPDGDMVHHHIRRTRKPFEPESMAFWEASLRPGRLALDIGAYTGLYAIRAAILGYPSYAFEPQPHVFERLRHNLRHNQVHSGVTPLRMAIGASRGRTRMHYDPSRLSSAATLVNASHAPTEVEVHRLDDFKFEKPISIMKIDVEGYEVPVLAGAQRILKRDRPNLILEANTKAALDDLLRMLPDYTMERVDERNVLAEPC